MLSADIRSCVYPSATKGTSPLSRQRRVMLAAVQTRALRACGAPGGARGRPQSARAVRWLCSANIGGLAPAPRRCVVRTSPSTKFPRGYCFDYYTRWSLKYVID